jgi:hypothetical protein
MFWRLNFTNTIPFGPAAITNQPSLVAVTELQPTILGVGLSGMVPRLYQWYSNDVAMVGETNQTFQILFTPLSASGSVFRVTITNDAGGTVSSNILLSVLPDLERPALWAADASPNYDSVTVTFSERISAATATNIGLYSITNQAGQPLQLFQVTRVDAVTVRLLTAQLSASEQYVLRVSGMQDMASASNRMAPNAGVILGHTIDLVNFDHADGTSLWRFYGVDGDMRTELAGWTAIDFMDFLQPFEGWEEGYGLIAYVPGVVGLPAQQRTLAPMRATSPAYALPCYYFRIKFNFRDFAPETSLQLRHIVDDGAVFYLNGQEINRFHIGAGSVACATVAVPVANGTIVGPFTISATNLISGTNVLAVEVHQESASSQDILFGAELKAVIASVLLTDHIPRLLVQITNRLVRLDWTAPGYTLEQAVAVTGAWETVDGVVNNTYSTSATNAARFFRLRQ